MPGPTYIPAASAAQEWLFTGDTVGDAVVYPAYNAYIADAAHVPYKVQNELLGMRQAAVSGKQFQVVYACVASVAVGNPVYPSGVDTVAKALATSLATSTVIGFVIYKPTTTTCVLVNFYYVSGLVGLTTNSPVYLQDAGGVGPAAGTFSVPLGIAISTTEALIFASPLSAGVGPGTTIDENLILQTRSFA